MTGGNERPNPVTLRPERPAHGGTVVAHRNGGPVLVAYAMPGELVEAEPTGRRGGVELARVVRVIEPSPDRVSAPCPHFGECGGCQWQHARYDRQLELKRQVVDDAWRGVGLRLPVDTPVLGMEDPWRYRIRGEFEARSRASRLELGFHRMRSHAVLPIHTCPIHDERIERALPAFRQAAEELGWHDLQSLRLTVEPTGRGLLWWAQRRGSPPGVDPALGARVAELLPDLVLLDDSMSLEIWGLIFRVRSDTFVQTNYRQMLVLYQVVVEMLRPEPTDSLLDLYAGIGTIGLLVANRVRSVTAIEENLVAARLSVLNARINGVNNFKALPGRTEDVLRQLRTGRHQAAVLDPPRAGCDAATIAELLRLAPDRLVYVSCEPTTQARDVSLLVRGGYRVRRAVIVDMFPHTYHVESVVLLERAA
jgi:23S rRNA (uracil1939-C5)-methyltransferase